MMNNKQKKLYDFISELNKKAYRDVFLLSSQVLSKNSLTTKLLNRYLYQNDLEAQSFVSIAIKLLRYYKYSIKEYCHYISKFIRYSFIGLTFSNPDAKKELILIDTFLLTNKLEPSKEYSDSYFPGLEELLKKQNRHYAYLPVFYNLNKELGFTGMLRIIKKSRMPIISEYQLLSSLDLIRILYFILFYPYRLLKFRNRIASDSYEGRLVRYELIDTLADVTFYSFSRYLQGRKIARMPYEKIKVISWYENQVIHKNLYRGLRDSTGKVQIYGAQLFLYSKNVLNIPADENEETSQTVPDRIITNGGELIPKKTKLNYSVGPSLRYSKIFEVEIKPEEQNNILILLPYMYEDAKNLLRIVLDARIDLGGVMIKAHPGTPIEYFQSLLPSDAVITNQDVYSLFKKTRIMIGASSGTLLEAASLGVPVISVRNTRQLDLNPLPERGRGVIWSEVSNADDLRGQIEKLEDELSRNPEKIKKIADSYKEGFFNQPSEQNIKQAFDL